MRALARLIIVFSAMVLVFICPERGLAQTPHAPNGRDPFSPEEANLLDRDTEKILDALRKTTGQEPPDKVAHLVWRTLFTQCAGPGTSSVSFFATQTWGWKWLVNEYRGAVLPVDPEPLTEADRANNVQWRGTASFKYTISRSIVFGADGRPEHGSWSKWKDESGFKLFNMKKENNRWLVDVALSGGLPVSDPYRPLDEFANGFARGDYRISNARLSCTAALATDPFSTLPSHLKPVPKTRSEEVHITPHSAGTDDAPGKVYKKDEPGVSAPVIIQRAIANYTEEARKAKLQGHVLCSFVVDQNGDPQDIRVISGLGMGLDEDAVKTVRKCKFRPGTRAGHPVRVQFSINIEYRLR